MQSFNISSPANFSGILMLLGDLALTNSATVSGQFQLDIQTGNFSVSLDPLHPSVNIPPPDQRPVFDWSITISLDSNTHSITLKIDVKYDHKESNNSVEEIGSVFLGFISGGLFSGILAIALGIAGIAVGEVLTQVYNAKTESDLLNALGGPFNGLLWVDKIQFSISHPSNKEFILSVTYQLDPSTWSRLVNLFNINNAGSVGSLAKGLRLAS